MATNSRTSMPNTFCICCFGLAMVALQETNNVRLSVTLRVSYGRHRAVGTYFLRRHRLGGNGA